MKWTTVVVDTEHLAGFVAKIRKDGGTITSCRPQPDGVAVTWTSPPESSDPEDS